ncbi:tagaturonate reductase [Salmonirosea aquatica]|uniref:tagaturonate reductase n=1 Tax=Salmonirosea aquatica TaxID=2654236 RepID=UPI0035712D86
MSQRTELYPDYARLAALPEKILQFGTGVLLRGLPDYFVDKANKNSIFNGRIVVVKSTDRGGVDAFKDQDDLFTHCIRGVEAGEAVEETFINSAISRTLSARNEWNEILACARNPEITIVISNTTEVGIQLVEDDLKASPPESFPGKLTAYLHERFRTFNGSPESGMVIVPTELVVDNGKKLRDIVLEQSRRHNLGEDFIQWLNEHNHFCSSLVDRIVPGLPDEATQKELTDTLGYQDELLIMSESYRLWAIEGGPQVRSVLNFAEADAGVIIEPDIDLHRELKLRLLNGSHTFSVASFFLSGMDTVRESMENPELEHFITELTLNELAPAIPYKVDLERARTFGRQVLDRFRNPYIKHQLIDITVQYTAKMKMRNVPTLLSHYEKFGALPARMAEGFAAYILFMKPVETDGKSFFGERNGVRYPIRCDAAPYFEALYKEHGTDYPRLVSSLLSDAELWGTDLSHLPGFQEGVLENLQSLVSIKVADED